MFEGVEVVAAVVEGSLAAEDLVSNEQAEGFELGAVPADVDDLAPVPLMRYVGDTRMKHWQLEVILINIANLVLVHFEGQSLQSRADSGEQRLHVGELHRDEVEFDEMLQCRHVIPWHQVILVHHGRLREIVILYDD